MKPPSSHPRSKRGLSAPASLVLLVAASAALLAWWNFHEQKEEARVLATINGKPLTLLEASMALRANVWKQGLYWADLLPEEQAKLREETLQQLISQALVRENFSTSSAELLSDPAGEEAFQQFLKQFEDPEVWLQRANLQNLDEMKLRALLDHETMLTTALERDLLKRIQPVSDAEAKAWYEANQSQFFIPESARASQIFLTRHDSDKPYRGLEIAELHRALTAGEVTFSQAATTVSEDDRSNKKGGDLGWFSRSRVPEDFAAVTFSLSAGQTSSPFETTLGWHIVWLKEKRPSRTARFDEVKNEIISLLGDHKREIALAELLNELREKYPVSIQSERLAELQPPS